MIKNGTVNVIIWVTIILTKDGNDDDDNDDNGGVYLENKEDLHLGELRHELICIYSFEIRMFHLKTFILYYFISITLD